MDMKEKKLDWIHAELLSAVEEEGCPICRI